MPPPVYHRFLDSAYTLSDRVEMIHPARFLFNAGSTPKAWNEKMLADPHLKVEFYEPDATKVFPDTSFMGGIAITYRDATRDFGAIGTFTPFEELNSIKQKVCERTDFRPLSEITFSRTSYRLTEALHQEHPEAAGQLSKGHRYDMSTNIFELLPQVFSEKKPEDGKDYIQIYGREKGERVFRWIRKDYVNEPRNLCRWKVFVPAANGSGALGEVLTTPLIGEPLIGSTETFIRVGGVETQAGAGACLAYGKAQVARAIGGILKITATVTPSTQRYVPLQDFTAGSDIDWGRTIAEIDQRLYKKYGLSDDEVAFIESKVEEME